MILNRAWGSAAIQEISPVKPGRAGPNLYTLIGQRATAVQPHPAQESNQRETETETETETDTDTD